MIRESSGDTTVEPPFTDIDRDIKKSWGHWDDYVGEHRDGQLEVEEVFNIDLNTLISLDVQLEMMYHTTVPYEQ